MEHTFFNSNKWATRTASLDADIEIIAPDNIVAAMIRGKDVCNRVAHYAEAILQVNKEKLERL